MTPAVDQIMADEVVTSTSSPGTSRWMLTDQLNTVRDVIDNSGTVVDHIAYSSFGIIVSQTNSSAQPRILWTGRAFDSATGLQNNWHRWYDPAVGKWVSEDPIGFSAGDSNFVRHVGNRPTTLVDPSGLDTEYAAEGRVKQEAIKEALRAKYGDQIEFEVGVDRVRNCETGATVRGRADARLKGRFYEVGPASPTGVPFKLEQLESIDGNGKGILYRQSGIVPKEGDAVEYVVVSMKRLKEIAEDAKKNNLNAEQIWKELKKAGTVQKTTVSGKALEAAGRLFLRGRKIIRSVGESKALRGVGNFGKGVLKCINAVNVIMDTYNWVTDPKGEIEKIETEGTYIFPGVLVPPTKSKFGIGPPPA